MNSRRRVKGEKDIDFFLVGPGHSGTTSLNATLNQHPDIFLPAESNFYTWTNQFCAIDALYGDNEAIFFGEHANNYFSFSGIPALIGKTNPAAKIVVVVQDPIRRIIRNYRHDIRWGVLGRFITLKIALAENYLRTRYIQPSRYVYNLDRWLEHFPPEQIFVFSNEPERRTEAIQALLAFIGAAPFEPDVGVRKNESVFTLIPEIHRHATFGAGRSRDLARLFEPVNRWLGERLVGAPQVTDADLAEARRLLGEEASLDYVRCAVQTRGLRGWV
jgi:hypothetical protein